MAWVNNKKSTTTWGGLLPLLKPVAVVVLFLVGFPIVYKWWQNLQTKQVQNDVENNIKQAEAVVKQSNAEAKAADVKTTTSKVDNILKTLTNKSERARLAAAARKLAKAFLTDAGIPWYDLRQYIENFEDDRGAANILIAETNNIKWLQHLYQYVYTENRNLAKDYEKYLDDSEKKRVEKVWKQHGKGFV